MLKHIFKNQLMHLIAVSLLLLVLYLITYYGDDFLKGELFGKSSTFWFCLAVVAPILHQTYVWLIWRLELYTEYFSSHLGWQNAFRTYSVGFSLLFVSRLIFLTLLAYVNRDTLEINNFFSYGLISVITPIVLYLFYSVKKYFTIQRAYGIDHFDKTYNEPYVRGGIFRYTNNGMYIYGLMILYIPALFFFSKGALLVAFFNHIYIWVHYYATELPDMRKIYGKAP